MGTPCGERPDNAAHAARAESPLAFLAIHTPTAIHVQSELISKKSSNAVNGTVNRNVSYAQRLCCRAHKMRSSRLAVRASLTAAVGAPAWPAPPECCQSSAGLCARPWSSEQLGRPLLPPLRAGGCPKADRRSPGNQLLIQRPIKKVEQRIGRRRSHWVNQQPSI